MTDHIFALTVTLKRDVRDDDIQTLKQAILQLRGVLRHGDHDLTPEEFSAQWNNIVRALAALAPASPEKEGGHGIL